MNLMPLRNKIMPTLRAVKEQASKMVPVKQQQNLNYKTLIDSMWKFEEEGLAQYTDSNYNKFIVGDPSSPEIKNQWELMSTELSNPFQEFFYWIVGEINDIEALQEAIQGRDKTLSIKQKIEAKKKSDTEELNKLNTGKKTMSTIFKSSSGKQAKIIVLTSNITQAEKELEGYDKLLKMIEVHLGENVIPKFKESQMKAYYKLCQAVADLEINDSSKVAKFWASFLENNNIKNV